MELTFPQHSALKTVADAGGLESKFVHRGALRAGHANLGVVKRLQKRKLVEFDGVWRLTPAGAKALTEAKVRPA